MNELQITEYKNIRVLTTQQIAEAYGTDSKTISYNFNHNKERYIDGKHFICLSGDELRAFREIHDLPNNLNKLYLWTEKGAFLHAKSLNTGVCPWNHRIQKHRDSFMWFMNVRTELFGADLTECL